MSVHISKRLATTPVAGGRAIADSLPPSQVRAAARRLPQVALLVSGLTCFWGTLDLLGLHRNARPENVSTPWIFAMASSLVLSLSVAWIASRPRIPAQTVLDVGLFYEVLEALLIAISVHEVLPPEGYLPRGLNVVATWIVIFPLVVPNSRRKTIVATLLAAVMDPLGFLIDTAILGRPVPARSVLLFLSTIVATGVSIVIYRIVHRLSVEAGRAHELGSYRLEKLLGQGGMGEVWVASHRLLARSAAIKLIRPETFDRGGAKEALRRFEREARATAALRSVHTVEVYDFGTTEDGKFYYVMELLDGLDADRLVREHGPLPPERAAFLLLQACESLEEAHARGLIHRDIKPANIHVCRYGLKHDFIKVLDFGLVKGGGPLTGEVSLTATGMVAGTPEYIAPEMARGEGAIDHRADLYALGCVAYWLLTGQTVFEGQTPMDLMIEHVRSDPVRPSEKSGLPVPAALEDLVMDCLQKDPQNRPQSAGELASRLQALGLDDAWTPEKAEQWWLGLSADVPDGVTSGGPAAPLIGRFP